MDKLFYWVTNSVDAFSEVFKAYPMATVFCLVVLMLWLLSRDF